MSKSIHWVVALIGLTSVGLRAQAEAEIVTLKSGRALRGFSVAPAKDHFWFEDKELGLVRVPLDRVRHHQGGTSDLPILRPLAGSESVASPKSYVRHVAATRQAGGALLTGTSRWHHSGRDLTLFLVGAVHIGEPDYFASLQRRLDACDLVLFEGVRGDPSANPEQAEQALRQMDQLRRLQLEFGSMLGLSFQTDHVNYARPFWQNCDVSLTAMRTEMQARKVSLPTDDRLYLALTKMAMGVLRATSGGESGRLRLRGQVGRMLGMADVLMAQWKGLSSILIDWRNEAAWRHVDRELAEASSGKWIALFYGAAHLPDFARRAELAGFRCVAVEWVKAWETR